MKSLTPYLVFSGDCKDAMEFYADTFGGEITHLQTFGDSPVPISEENKNRIFNAQIIAGDICIKASDDLPESQVNNGTNISLFVNFSDENKKRRIFDLLSQGGKVLFPMEENFGMLKDKFGIQWMLVNE